MKSGNLLRLLGQSENKIEPFVEAPAFRKL